jgi:hypothetical protein
MQNLILVENFRQGNKVKLRYEPKEPSLFTDPNYTFDSTQFRPFPYEICTSSTIHQLRGSM